MLRLVSTILLWILFNFHQTEVEGRHVNVSHIEMTQPLRSLSSRKLNLPANTSLSASARKPKFFSQLSFLTGLGLGSLAGAAAFAEPSLSPPGNFNNFMRTPSTTTRTTTTTTESPLNEVKLNLGGAEFPSSIRPQQANDYDGNYPYSAGLSTNALLLDQSLKSVTRILMQLKARMEQKEITIPTTATADYDEIQDASRIDVKIKENRMAINCSMLRDIIRASVAQEIERINRKPARQGNPADEDQGSGDDNQSNAGMDENQNGMDSTNDDVAGAAANINNSTISTSTTPTTQRATSTTQITPTVPQFQGYYYGGTPQNISGVDITSGAYGPPGYPSYPPNFPPNEIYHGLPTFGAAPFHHQEYTPEAYLVYPDAPDDHFTGLVDSNHDYSRYGRGEKFISKSNVNLDNGNGFVPSNFLSRG